MSDYDIEVCFGDVDSQVVLVFQVPAGTTVRNAVLESKLPVLFPSYDFSVLECGVYGQGVPDHHLIHAGDRVEVYRPLVLDPKARRRLKAMKTT